MRGLPNAEGREIGSSFFSPSDSQEFVQVNMQGSPAPGLVRRASQLPSIDVNDHSFRHPTNGLILFDFCFHFIRLTGVHFSRTHRNLNQPSGPITSNYWNIQLAGSMLVGQAMGRPTQVSSPDL
jgi:hypothetical protein